MTWPLPGLGSMRPLGEIVRFHLVLAAFLGGIGYLVSVMVAGQVAELGSATGGLLGEGPVGSTIASTGAETWGIATHNLAFFALVSILPVANIALVAPQFLALGSHAYVIKDLSWTIQVEMLYRHTVFEIFALMISVAISYLFLFAVRDFVVRTSLDRTRLRQELMRAARLYPAVVALTLLGAFLEGGAVVHI